jgi:DNA polymerase III subunit delta
VKKIDHLKALEKYLKETSSAELKPLFFILGDQPFELTKGIDLLLHCILPDSLSREHSLMQLDGSQLSETDLLAAFQPRSLFLTNEVILIRHVEKIKKSIIEKLEKEFLNFNHSKILILSGSNSCKNMPLYQSVGMHGQIVEFSEIKPWEKEGRLAEWVNEEIQADNKNISMQACHFFINYIGLDQNILAQELEKLLCYCHQKESVTEREIMAICTKQHSHTIWQLGESILRRETKIALQVAHSLCLESQSILPLLRQIRSQFEIGCQICSLIAEGKNPTEIGNKYPYMKGKILLKNIDQAKRYGLSAFTSGLIEIDASEMKAKSAGVEDAILLELLIAKLTM